MAEIDPEEKFIPEEATEAEKPEEEEEKPNVIDILGIHGLEPTVTKPPTWIPTKLSEQKVVYFSSSSNLTRYYIFDSKKKKWRYVNLT